MDMPAHPPSPSLSAWDASKCGPRESHMSKARDRRHYRHSMLHSGPGSIAESEGRVLGIDEPHLC